MTVESPTTRAPEGADRSSGFRVPVQVHAVVWTLLLSAGSIAAAMVLPGMLLGALLAGLALMYLFRRQLFSWPGLLVVFLAIVMFIPVRRYSLGIPLPFALEPYRLILVLLAIGIAVFLLIDPRLRWRPAGFAAPIAVFVGCLFLSLAVNVAPLLEQGLASNAVGALINFLLMISAFFIVRVLLQSERVVVVALITLAAAAAIVGFFATVERLTAFNVFLQLHNVLPLQLMSEGAEIIRSGGARSFGSAQHPIALGVMLAMMMPLGIYLALHSPWPRKPGSRNLFWLAATLAMGMGVVCTVSRTSFVMLALMAILLVLLRPGSFKPLVFVGLPASVLVSLVAPGAVLNMINSFLDPEELIASQYASAGWTGSGRLSDLAPSLEQAARYPLFGTSIGSRIVVGENRNAFILDNQILSTLLESGAVGVIGVLVLFLVPIFRILSAARDRLRAPRHGDLAVALFCSLSGYFLSLFFFDAFGFIQTFLLFFVLLAIGAWLLTETERPLRERQHKDRSLASAR